MFTPCQEGCLESAELSLGLGQPALPTERVNMPNDRPRFTLSRVLYLGPAKTAANEPESRLKLTGAGGRQACLDDWIEGKAFQRWDQASGTVTKHHTENLKAEGWIWVELWKTNPLVQRVCRIRL